MSLGVAAENVDDSTTRKLLTAAVHFAGSEKNQFKKIAHQIAILITKLNQEAIEKYSAPLGSIWTQLGNFPTRDFVLESYEENLDSLRQVFQNNFKINENTVLLSDSRKLRLTDFQKNVWESMIENKIIAITAPTSAGKSFSLINFLVNKANIMSKFYGCYIVPTRALINQVSNNLNERARDFKISDQEMVITSVPVSSKEINSKKCIYVLTQERLQVLVQEDPSLEFDFIIVDEAQSVGDSSRGVILQSIIEDIRNSYPNTKILFGSPFSKNPDIFGLFIEGSSDNLNIVSTEESPVVQNILKLETIPGNTQEVNVYRLDDDFNAISLGSKKLATELVDDRYKLPFLAYEFGKEDQNLVYSSGPAQCEEYANLISQFVEASGNKVTDEIMEKRKEFSKFIKENIHKDYILGDTVLNGVAFHYGNMPAIVRKTIEDYFEQRVINFLVCTSTLLHGVNFPAKNLFMNSPQKGKNTPISSNDFWNLVGRAGRLGKDLEGNIYLIDHNRWSGDPIKGEKLQKIKSSYYLTLSSYKNDLFKFIENDQHKSGLQETELLETCFQKVLKDYNGGKLDRALRIAFDNVDDDIKKQYKEKAQKVIESLKLPREIYEKHINISSYRQQIMHNYLAAGIVKKGASNYIPKYPLQEGAGASYALMFHRIHTEFEGKSKKSREGYFFGGWGHSWMIGAPLAKIINDFHSYRVKNSKSKDKNKLSIATSIRECLDLVESSLRFKYVKYSRCYIDILRHTLIELKHEKLIDSLPNVSLFLELGASSKTMVNFIGLGLSRTTSSILNDKCARKDMTSSDCLAWLKKSNLVGMGISKICIDEINKILR
ncbi:MAG: hypothetical protein A2381_13480 [Bdellovibrionales bacterium RIFOXYB1_FULL_37_110]|nr:MAG: hypothetical protein A2417_08140 [Bdellovibrionales bacterium RIFOXYC1_FULL_37_79]OFZ59457.1 MAG: hypothetical protein A2381_13480 [Bdellovibrionales bacterium RIFOXYB1_FULL_37_110]OFZ64304.1 MAG: hypothetical protein A2577_02605 [Bdellovibrionales bacterium RIFOXYD1_FULL_36_51]